MKILDNMKTALKDTGKSNIKGLVTYGPGPIGADFLDLGVKKLIGLSNAGKKINISLKGTAVRRVISKEAAAFLYNLGNQYYGKGTPDEPKIFNNYAATTIGSIETDLIYQVMKKEVSGLFASGADLRELGGKTVSQQVGLGGGRDIVSQQNSVRRKVGRTKSSGYDKRTGLGGR